MSELLRVAVFTDIGWALGRITRGIKKHLRGATVDIWDWTNATQNAVLFAAEGKWRQYDFIVTNTGWIDAYGDHCTNNPDFADLWRRLVIIFHCPRFDHHYFKERVVVYNDTNYGGVSQETCAAMKQLGVAQPRWVPFGADSDDFELLYTSDIVRWPIRRVGVIGGRESVANAEYRTVKGLDMFSEICEQANLEPVVISARPSSETTSLYADIDLLICCSTFDGGPLGIFEAASCGVPVLMRPVGNAQDIRGIALFDTVDEAVDQIAAWNNSESLLKAYRNRITADVRSRWSMQTCVQEHLEPWLHDLAAASGRLASKQTRFDFVEIGTSDFDTLIASSGPDAVGLCIEPLRFYLDRLPNRPHVRKLARAISDHSGQLNVYYVEPATISQYELPFWVRGCNSVGERHPTVVKLLEERNLDAAALIKTGTVPVQTLYDCLLEHRAAGVGFLKIDTEGHDCTILRQFALDVETHQRRDLLPERIQFESNSLADAKAVDDIIEQYSQLGYNLETRGYDTVLHRHSDSV